MSTDNIDDEIEITDDDLKALGPKKPAGDDDAPVEIAKTADAAGKEAGAKEGADKDRPLSAEEGKEDLAAQLKAMRETADAERRAREDAERRATEAAKQAEEARKEVGSREEQMLKNALETLKEQREHAKRAYRAAMESGDYGAAADAHEAIATAAARLTQVETAQAAHEARKAATPRTTHEGRVEKQGDAFEQAISGLSPASQAWARQNPTCFTDPEMYSRTLAAHYSAIADRIKPDSREYFQYLEERTGLREPAKAPDPQPQQRNAPRPAAPPHRGGNSTAASRLVGNTVTLTPAEREMAELSGLSYKEYAAQLIKAERNGELGTAHR